MTVTVFDAVALLLKMLTSFALRCVDAAGDPMMSVVVAVVMLLFVRPGVTVDPDKST
jgi:hypothetical protein